MPIAEEDSKLTTLTFRLYDAFTQVHQTNWTEFHGNANVSHLVYRTLTSSDDYSFSRGIGGLCGFTPRQWRTNVGTLDLPRKWPTLLPSCSSDRNSRYWDYTMDYKNPSGSPIFSTDPEIGFGTHGTIPRLEIGLGGYQVDNGAFANLTVSISPVWILK